MIGASCQSSFYTAPVKIKMRIVSETISLRSEPVSAPEFHSCARCDLMVNSVSGVDLLRPSGLQLRTRSTVSDVRSGRQEGDDHGHVFSHDYDMTGLRDSKKEAVRQRLYEAALHRFRMDGYENTSVAAICKDAGVAKGTFFNHFPNKADILAVWYADAMQSAELQRPAPGKLSYADALISWPLLAVAAARNDPDLWRAKHAYAPLSEAIQSAETEADNRLRKQTIELLSTTSHQGLLRAHIDLKAIADLYLAAVTGTIREWLNTGGRFDLTDTLKARITTLINLISA